MSNTSTTTDKALSAASAVALGVSTLFGAPTDYFRTASTAYVSLASRHYSAVNFHWSGIFAGFPMIHSIEGLSIAVFNKVWELSPLLFQYEALEPGFQISEGGSLILAMGTKGSNSVLLEFFYDSNVKSFEDEVSFVGRKQGKLTAEVLQKDRVWSTVAGSLG